jgi:hypothetical protein
MKLNVPKTAAVSLLPKIVDMPEVLCHMYQLTVQHPSHITKEKAAWPLKSACLTMGVEFTFEKQITSKNLWHLRDKKNYIEQLCKTLICQKTQ